MEICGAKCTLIRRLTLSRSQLSPLVDVHPHNRGCKAAALRGLCTCGHKCGALRLI